MNTLTLSHCVNVSSVNNTTSMCDTLLIVVFIFAVFANIMFVYDY